jgi:hypothetical protein
MEARWAVFFDWMHQPWLYEPQRFEFEDDSSYLPDFWLPGVRSWFEVKPSFQLGEGRPQRQLAVEFATSVYIGVGNPAWPYDHPEGQILRFAPNGGAYVGFHWTTCARCGRVAIDPLYTPQCPLCCEKYEGDSGANTARIVTATVASRTVRF